MGDDLVRGNEGIYSPTDPYNQAAFVIRQFLKDVSTALPVKVVSVDAGGSGSATGYVDVLPLVNFISGKGTAVQPVTLYHLPYFRLQGGKAAVVTDPVVGDIGLAVFAQADSSNVQAGTSAPVQPGSKRTHSQSDGFYIGGFLNQPPSCFLELKQDNTAVLTAPMTVTVNSADITLNGNTTVNGSFQVNGESNMSGGLTASGNIVSGNISLQSHVHGGVESGGSNTSGPQ